MELYASLKGEEPRLGDRRDLRLIFHIAHHNSCPGPLFLAK